MERNYGSKEESEEEVKAVSDELRLFLCEILLGWIIRIAPAKSYEGRRLIGIVKAYVSTIKKEPVWPRQSAMEDLRDSREMQEVESGTLTSTDVADIYEVFGKKGIDMYQAHVDEYHDNGMSTAQALADWRQKVRLAKEMKSRPSEFFDV